MTSGGPSTSPLPPEGQDLKSAAPEPYRRAAEALADAAEDLLWCAEANQGDHREALRAAWQAYVEVADGRASPRLRAEPTLPTCSEAEAFAEVTREDRDVLEALRDR